MGHKHSVRDTGARFVIDQYTRQIKNDSANKTTIVQYDHNSERLTFEIPLYVDGHAMTLCDLVEIHYINISTDGNSQNHGTYEVNDIKAEGEKAIFTWLVSQEGTQLAGSLNFFIVFKCTENGVTVYRWGTEIYKNLAISAGMDNGEAVLTEYPDILAQWKAQLFDASNTAVSNVATAEASALAAIEAAGEAKKQSVLDSIPDEYEELSAVVDQSHRNKAGAIVLDADGESIIVNDASEYPLQNLKVFGKSEQLKTTGAQLANLPDGNSVSAGVSWACKDGIVTAKGTTTGTSSTSGAIDFDFTGKVGTYTISGSTDNVSVYASVTKNGLTKWYNSTAFELDGTETQVNIYCQVYGEGKAVNETVYPMLNAGDTALPFEPYTGGVASPSPDYPQDICSIGDGEININVHSGNLFDANSLLVGTNTSLDVSEDEYTITVSGGTKTGWGSSSYFVPEDLVKMLRGKTVHLACDSFTTAQSVNVRMGLNITREDGKIDYPDSLSPTVFSRKFTISETAVKIQISLYANNTGTALESDNTIVIEGLRIGLESGQSWNPYAGQAATIPRTLPGVPVTSGGNYTDADGQRWVRDEIDSKRGVHVHKCGYYIFDGSDDEEWNGIFTHDSKKYVYIKVPRGSIQYTTPLICNYAKQGAWSSENVCFINNFAEFVIGGAALEGVLSSVTAFKAHLAVYPIMLAYVLETPVETALSDAEINAFKALHSNKPNTTILNDSGAFMAVEYVADTKTYIDNKIKEMMEGVTE